MNADDAIVMVLRGSATTGATKLDGQYLKSMDFEAHGGRGDMLLTPAREQAMRFATMEDAWHYWRRVPLNRPRRGDGQPNRPLTAMNWEFAGAGEP